MLKRFSLNKTVQFLFFAVSLAVVILLCTGAGSSSASIVSRGSGCRGGCRGAFLFIIDSSGRVNSAIRSAFAFARIA